MHRTQDRLSRVALVALPVAIISVVIGALLPFTCLAFIVGLLGLVVCMAMVTSLSASLMARPWARDFFEYIFGKELVEIVPLRPDNTIWLLIPSATVLLSAFFGFLLSVRLLTGPAPNSVVATQQVPLPTATNNDATFSATLTMTTTSAANPAFSAETPEIPTPHGSQSPPATLTPLATNAPPETPTAPPTPRIVIAEVHGRNSGFSSFDQEYIVLLNFGPEVEMEGWTVTDEDNHRYIFPDFQLEDGQGVRLYTGSGRNSAGALFWGRSDPVWDPAHDTVYLRDDQGILIDRYSY